MSNVEFSSLLSFSPCLFHGDLIQKIACHHILLLNAALQKIALFHFFNPPSPQDKGSQFPCDTVKERRLKLRDRK